MVGHRPLEEISWFESKSRSRAEKSETIDWISEPDNEIEFLIFKQAIDTGWDCPRAHILVKFRETHNIVFEIQTVGQHFTYARTAPLCQRSTQSRLHLHQPKIHHGKERGLQSEHYQTLKSEPHR